MYDTYCGKCGAPYSVESPWFGITPPPPRPTCNCWNTATTTIETSTNGQTWWIVPEGISEQYVNTELEEEFIKVLKKIRAYLDFHGLMADEVDFILEDNKLVIKPKQEK